MHQQATQQLRGRINELAADIGRLRKRLDALTLTAEQIANHVETIAGFLEPTAAELANWHAPGDPIAIDEAIRIVDERANRLQKQLGSTNGD